MKDINTTPTPKCHLLQETRFPGCAQLLHSSDLPAATSCFHTSVGASQRCKPADLVPSIEVGPPEGGGAGPAAHVLQQEVARAQLLLPGQACGGEVGHLAEEVGRLVGAHVPLPDDV